MAARPDVSYNPVNSVAPETGSGNDYLKIDASPNDFGAQVGGAVEKAGQVAEQYGAEKVDLATHMSQMYSDSAARDGVVAMSQKLGDLENAYKQNRGINAPAAYKDFQDKVNQLYETSATNMPNDFAQKLFRDQASKEVGYSMKTAGAWAADQTEQGQELSLNASIANRVNQFTMASGDPARRQQLASGIRDDALQYAQFKGLSADLADKLVSQNVGEGYAAMIKSTALSDPEQAKALYNEAINGSFTVPNRNGAGGAPIKVPYLDAQHQMQVQGEMNGIFRDQFKQQMDTAQTYAKAGADFDQNAFIMSGRNAGKSDEYLKAEIGRLAQVKGKFSDINGEYSLQKTIDADTPAAFAGQSPQGNYDKSYLESVIPNNPQKAAALANQGAALNDVAGEVAQWPTKNINDIPAEIDAKYKPGTGTSAPATSGEITAYSPEVNTALNNAAKAKNVPSSYMYATTQIESRGKANAKNPIPGTTSEGLGQFTDATAKKYGITDKNDPNQSANGTADYYNDNKKDLTKSLGYEPTDAQVYLAHQQGAGGASALINHYGENAVQTLVDHAGLSPDEARDHILHNGGTADETAGQFAAKWIGTFNKYAADGGTDASQAQSVKYSTMISAYNKYRQDLFADPSGTLQSKDQNLTDLLNQGMQDPSKMGVFVQKSLTQQIAAGVLADLQTALPAAQATKYAQGIMSAGANAPDMIHTMSQQWGNSWPEIYHSLVTRGGLTMKYQAIASLAESDDPNVVRDAGLLARWGADPDIKKKTVEDLMPSKGVATIKSTIDKDDSYMKWRTALYASGVGNGAVEQDLNNIESLAYAKTLYTKDTTPASAASGAVKSFVSKYSFMPTGNAYVPGNMYNVVSQNAQATLDNLNENKIAVPPLPYGMKSAEYVNIVKAHANWVTSLDGNSLQLKDPGDRKVLGKDGKPISVPFTSTLTPEAVKTKDNREFQRNVAVTLAAAPFSGAGVF